MIAKEKAIELYEFFEGYPLTIDWVKQCAIKCVDEIISVIEFMAESDEADKLPFWKEVKEEINKI